MVTRSVRPAVLVFLATAAGCASAAPAPPAPPVNARQVVGAAERASALDAPYRLVFEWSSTEPESRLSGRGVARIEPPYRARLDLFTSNGERVAVAALEGDRSQVPSDVQTEVPPPPLLWGALGVFRPGAGTGLTGGRLFPSGEIEIRYVLPGGREILYRLLDDRIQRIEVLSGGRTVEEISLVRVADERFPRRATYRHLGEVRELSITLESAEHVESYPTDIWDLGL